MCETRDTQLPLASQAHHRALKRISRRPSMTKRDHCIQMRGGDYYLSPLRCVVVRMSHSLARARVFLLLAFLFRFGLSGARRRRRVVIKFVRVYDECAHTVRLLLLGLRDLLYFRLVASMLERLLSVRSWFLWCTSCPAFTFPSFLSVSRATFLPAISLRCLFCVGVWLSYFLLAIPNCSHGALSRSHAPFYTEIVN